MILTGQMRFFHLLLGLIGLLAVAFAAPASEDTLPPHSATCAASDGPIEYGMVRICNGRRGQGHCVDVDPGLVCQQLSKPIRFNVQSFRQSKGSICWYTRGSNCKNHAFKMDSRKYELFGDVTSTLSFFLSGVYCNKFDKPSQKRTDAVVAQDVSSFAVLAESKPKFDARLYTDYHARGHGLDFSVKQPCSPLPEQFRNTIKSWTLSPNITCDFYKSDECSKKNRVFGATNLFSREDWTDNMPTEYQNQIALVQCSDHKHKGIFMAADSPLTPTIDPTTHHVRPVGNAQLCSADLTTGSCFNVLANSQCTGITGPVDRNVSVIYHNRGSYCEYFDSDSCDRVLGHDESKLGNLRVHVPAQYVNRIASARCDWTDAYYMSGGAEEEHEFAAPFLKAETSGE